MTLNDPRVGSDEYASERGLQVRRSIYDNAGGKSPILLTHGAGRVPDVDGPIRAGARTTVFVATKAG